MRENSVKYGILAVISLLGMLFAIIVLESVPAFGLFGIAMLFFGCSAGLLFCLMKLDVMDFSEGTILYVLNQRVNMSTQRRYVSGRQSARHIMLAE